MLRRFRILMVLGLLGLASGGARAEEVYGITGAAAGGSLVRFDSASPGTVTTIGTLTGVLTGHSVRAIDFRPMNGGLYALSVNNANVGQIYLVDLSTAALTPIGSGFTFAVNPDQRVSMDFNPVVDRIRIVTNNDQSLRVHPDTGALVAQDSNLAYDAGDTNAGVNPAISGVAYTNNVPFASSTTLYGWDTSFALAADNLVTVIPPNAGVLNTVGLSNIVSDDGGVGFDISGNTGIAYLSFNDGAERFGTVNLANGNVTVIGNFPVDMLDIAVRPTAVPEPSTLLLGGLGMSALGKWRRRRKAAAAAPAEEASPNATPTRRRRFVIHTRHRVS